MTIRYPKLNGLFGEAFDLLVFVQAECLIILRADAQFLSGTVERPTDKKTSQCFAIATGASSHPISCGMATSRNWPRRAFIPSCVGANDCLETVLTALQAGSTVAEIAARPKRRAWRSRLSLSGRN
jgi:hypothetical protein